VPAPIVVEDGCRVREEFGGGDELPEPSPPQAAICIERKKADTRIATRGTRSERDILASSFYCFRAKSVAESRRPGGLPDIFDSHSANQVPEAQRCVAPLFADAEAGIECQSAPSSMTFLDVGQSHGLSHGPNRTAWKATVIGRLHLG